MVNADKVEDIKEAEKNIYSQKVVIIDAHALIHRAYHAMPNLTTKAGVPSGAIFGLTNMLLLMLREIDPESVVACYDLPKATFRHLAFDDYKSNRKGSDEALVSQIIDSRKVFAAFGIDMIDKEGYEADDCIGTLVKILKIENKKIKKIEDNTATLSSGGTRKQIIIVSGDMDIMQMVEGDESVMYTLKKEDSGYRGFYYTEEEVYKKHGIYPAQIPDYKGLAGDSSDNIPGIKGIGDKTAVAILTRDFDLDKVYEGIEDKDHKYFGITERMFGLLRGGKEEAMFSKALATINNDVEINFSGFKKYNLEDNLVKLNELCDEYGFTSIKKKMIGLENKSDTTNNFADFEKKDNPEIDKKESKEKDQKDEELKNENILHWSGGGIKKAKIAIWLLRSEETDADLERIIYLTKKSDEKECIEYLEVELKKENLLSVYEEIEVPLIPILSQMNKIGIKMDREKLSEMLKVYDKEKEAIVKEVYKLAGREFNLNSPKQLGEVLYGELELGEKIKKTKGGKLSTGAEMLHSLVDAHPIVQLVLDYREKEKMTSTYIEPLLMHSAFDGRVHTTYLQTGAATGRFASVNPGLQNIPVRGTEGASLRSCFIAGEGKVLVAADYSQIELRIAGMLSGDEYLEKIFNTDLDIHTIIATKMFSVSEADVTKDMRRAAKAMNFGIIYGMGVSAIKADLGVERVEAQRFYDAYTLTMETLMKFLNETKESARANGYTQTLYGRRRNIKELFSALPFLKAQGERIAMNAPIQGTSADIIKLAMIDFDKIVKQRKWQGKVEMLLQIHDELVVECDEDMAEEVSQVLKDAMQNVLEVHKPKQEYTKIKITANPKIGKNWSEME
jgi:DNA polymerase I